MSVRVRTAGRLHVGFLNLSLARERLYGGIGLALDGPETIVHASQHDEVSAPDGVVADYAHRSVSLLGVPGATVDLEASLPRHAGLGSGTQLALSVYTAIAAAYDLEPDVRAAAPGLDRGGRSGVGVATFESGGFVVDAGHPTERFTSDRPEPGDWDVPAVMVRSAVPADWRFVVVLPDVAPGRSGDEEDASMRSTVEDASPVIADEISVILTERLFPAIAEGRGEAFGRAVAAIDRRNGVWYADEQGGLYRPPVGGIVDDLGERPAVFGVGQSSWGPAVYGVTDSARCEEAERAATAALEAAGCGGEVFVARGRNEGATIDRLE